MILPFIYSQDCEKQFQRKALPFDFTKNNKKIKNIESQCNAAEAV